MKVKLKVGHILTIDDVKEIERLRWGYKFLEKEAPFTCHDCQSTETCEYAFDLYNLNGDCLAIK